VSPAEPAIDSDWEMLAVTAIALICAAAVCAVADEGSLS
jgi:hypothetical protein